MKTIFAVLLIVCTASATRKWAGMPDKHLKKLDNLLKDTSHITNKARFGSKIAFGNLLKDTTKDSAEQNDHSGEGSGVSPGEGSDIAIGNLVKLVSSLLPNLGELRKESEDQANGFAREFVTALKTQRDDDKVKSLFGRHVRLLFDSCNRKLVEFAKKAKEANLFKMIRHDFENIMGDVVMKVERGASFVDEFFHAVHKHDLHDHPVMKVLVAIGELLGDAACDFELDGFMKAIGGEMGKQEPEDVEEDGHSSKESSYGKALMVLKVVTTCSAIKRSVTEFPEEGIVARLIRLLFQGGCTFDEAFCVTDTVDIIKELIGLHFKFGALAHKAHRRKEEMVKKMIGLHMRREQEKADLMLANYVLDEMREGMLVGFFLSHRHDRDEPMQTARLEDKVTDNHKFEM